MPYILVILYNNVVKDLLSKRLEVWLKDSTPKTLEGFVEAFSEDGFATLLVLLMIFPAAPIPTAGITHVFEIISMLLGLELILGFDQIWLPKKISKKNLSSKGFKKSVEFLIRKLEWLEKYIIPTKRSVLRSRLARIVIGLLVILFSVFAFIAPPFSNLDTLPALGVVLLGIAMIFENYWVALLGVLAGAGGVSLVVFLSDVIFKLFK